MEIKNDLCMTCYGTGKRYGDHCPDCNGTGIASTFEGRRKGCLLVVGVIVAFFGVVLWFAL